MIANREMSIGKNNSFPVAHLLWNGEQLWLTYFEVPRGTLLTQFPVRSQNLSI
jgi:hypothetical protein